MVSPHTCRPYESPRPSHTWPDDRLVVVAVDAVSGERQVFLVRAALTWLTRWRPVARFPASGRRPRSAVAALWMAARIRPTTLTWPSVMIASSFSRSDPLSLHSRWCRWIGLCRRCGEAAPRPTSYVPTTRRRRSSPRYGGTCSTPRFGSERPAPAAKQLRPRRCAASFPVGDERIEVGYLARITRQ